MTTTNLIVFYFNFFDEITETEATFGFIFDSSPILASHQNLEIFLNSDSYEEIFEHLESTYGVHDWSSSPNPQVQAIGYTSYEVPPNKIPKLMSKWQKEFIKFGCSCSKIVQVDTSAAHGDDLQIYNNILSKI